MTMISKLLQGTFSLLALGLLFSSPSHAQTECAVADIQMAQNDALNMANATSATRGLDIIEALSAKHAKCGSEPNLELYIAYAFLKRSRISGSTPDQQLRDIHDAWQALARLSQSNSKPVETELYADVSETVFKSAVALTNNHGLALPHFSSDQPLPACPDYAGSVTQAIWHEYKKTQSGYAPAYIVKFAEACPLKRDASFGHPLFWKAMMFADKAGRASDREEALDYARSAFADLEKWMGARQDFPGTERSEIETVLKLRARLETEQTSKPKDILSSDLSTAISRVYAGYVIALGAAEIWDGSLRATKTEQLDAFKAQAMTMKTYIDDLDVAARANGREAQMALFEGMNAFASGEFSPETDPKFLAPPKVLWAKTEP